MLAQELAKTADELTFLQLLQTLEGDLKLVRRVERGRVVLNLATEQRDNRHTD
jgi:DNA-binding IscR family transcriptional regulator